MSAPGGKCWSCDSPLDKCPYIKCLRCPEMEQCLECFATAALVESHEVDHQFIIMDHIDTPLTRQDWTAEEDALLLFAIRMCGIGNWHEIEKEIPGKTALECETHYFETYIDCPTAPLPGEEILPPLTLPPPLPYDTTPRESRPSISNEHNLSLLGKKEPTTPGEYAGWMPLRHEYDIEHLNEAEEIIAGLTFSETEETEETLRFKLEQMQVYNNTILADRRYRHRICDEWGLRDREVTDLGGQTPEEQAIDRELMPMAQVVSKEMLLDFANTLHTEERSQADLNMLAKWKRNGIATHDEGFLFNKLEKIARSESITEEQVDEWNNYAMRLINSTEFRATLDREIMSPEENELTRELNIAPSSFLKIKELLMREFVLRGALSRKDVLEIAKANERIILPVYEYLLRNGLLLTAEGFRTKDESYQATMEAKM